MTTPVASRDERGQPTLVNGHRTNPNKDNWLGFVGDVVNFTVRYSYFDVRRVGANAALLQNEKAAHVGGWLIEHNRIQAPSAYSIRARNLSGD